MGETWPGKWEKRPEIPFSNHIRAIFSIFWAVFPPFLSHVSPVFKVRPESIFGHFRPHFGPEARPGPRDFKSSFATGLPPSRSGQNHRKVAPCLLEDLQSAIQAGAPAEKSKPPIISKSAAATPLPISRNIGLSIWKSFRNPCP